MDDDSKKNSVAEFHEGRIDDAAKAHRSWAIRITGICQRCNHSHIWKTERMSDPHVFCNIHDPALHVPTDVSQCNRFSQIGALSVWELAKLALDVDIKDKPIPAGFKAAKENA